MEKIRKLDIRLKPLRNKDLKKTQKKTKTGKEYDHIIVESASNILSRNYIKTSTLLDGDRTYHKKNPPE